MTTIRQVKYLAALSLLAAGQAYGVHAQSAVEAPGPAGPLKGAMIASEGPSGPVALMLPGSGPTDRDGNSPLGLQASAYRLLARDLAARGVTTVRIDKRGMFGSAAAVPDANAVTIGDYVQDVHAWVAMLRKQTQARCIWLIGHSEGGLVAMAAAKEQPGICGLVLLAAAGRPLGAVLREQIAKNPANAPILQQAMSTIDALERARRVDTSALHPALQSLFAPQVQGFLISAFSYDPASLLKDYPNPVLVLQGTRDLQVTVDDARLLQQANRHAVLVLLPDVNHVLKLVESDDSRANLATYFHPGLPLAPGIGATIADFLKQSAAVAGAAR